MLPLAVGCTDAAGRFDDFAEQVIDAGMRERIDAAPLDQVPDVTGTFLVGMAASVAPEPPFQFIGEIVLHDGPEIEYSMQPLHRFTREPVGGEPLTDRTPVTAGGQFVGDMSGDIDGDANVISGSDLTIETSVIGTIKSADLICGDIEGRVTSPVDLDLAGTTFAAIRIEPGTATEDLPDIVVECPPEGIPDAGVPDAPPPPPDAAAPDAAVPDGAVPDAAGLDA